MEKAETQESYARTLAKFAAALIQSLDRDETRFRLPLTNGVSEDARSLLAALESLPCGEKQKEKPSEGKKGEIPSIQEEDLSHAKKKAVRALQRLFLSAVTDSIKESQGNRFKCPVLAYIACFAYNSDDTFKVPFQLTSVLAHWQYLLRCTALYQGCLFDGSGEKTLEE